MKTNSSLIMTVLLLFAPLIALAQNDKQAWVHQFGTTFGSKELARSIATDSAGNAVVAGERGLGLGSNKFYRLRN